MYVYAYRRYDLPYYGLPTLHIYEYIHPRIHMYKDIHTPKRI